MPIRYLKKLLIVSDSKNLLSKPNFIWFALSLVMTAYFGLVSLQHAFSQNYIIQDDARHHVVWLQRFIDPDLFPNDLIANYFEAVAPLGFKGVYWLMAQVGVESLVLAKFLPLILGLVTAAYCFAISLQLLPIPFGAFTASVILTQCLWLDDNLTPGVARSFAYPLFCAFLYYLLKRSLVPCLIAIALQGLFYPQLLLVEMAVLTLRLIRWEQGHFRLSRVKADYQLWLAALVVTAIVLLPFSLATSDFGAVVTAAQAKLMPEYAEEGRSRYFINNPVAFWIGGDSGIDIPLYPPIILIGFLWPLSLKCSPLARYISRQAVLLGETVLASLGMFFLAHILFLKLHLPTRYTMHSLRVVLALAAGMTIVLLLDAGLNWLIEQQQAQKALSLKSRVAIAGLSVFAVASLVVPAIPNIFLSAHLQIAGRDPQVYEFFAEQPKDILIASLAEDANNLPAFSQRSVLVAREFALPYHTGYYSQIRQRAVDLIEAQYSPDITEVQAVIQKYGIDFWLVEPESFTASYLAKNPWWKRWLHQYEPAISEAKLRLEQGQTSALAQLTNQCSALQTEKFTVVTAACLMESQPSRL